MNDEQGTFCPAICLFIIKCNTDITIKSCKILYKFVGAMMGNGVLCRDPILRKDGVNCHESSENVVGGRLSTEFGGYTEIRIGCVMLVSLSSRAKLPA